MEKKNKVAGEARRDAKISEKKTRGIAGLVIALAVVLAGGVLFVGAVAGWFDDKKAVLSTEYRCTPVAEEAVSDETSNGSANAEEVEGSGDSGKSNSEISDSDDADVPDSSELGASDSGELELCTGEFADLSVEEYESLIAEKKSFLIVVDQPSCTTADKLKGYAKEYALKNGVKIYRMMYSDLKNSTLHEKIKYYPSFAVISNGEVLNFLRADSDEDAPAYNGYEDFSAWLNTYLEL